MGHDLQQAQRRLITRGPSLLAALGLLLPLVTPVHAAPAEPVELRLEIDTHAAGAGADVLHRRIEERANIALRYAKVLPGGDDDRLVVVSVRELDGEEPGYTIALEVYEADRSVAMPPIEASCSLCTETELVAQVEAELEQLLPRLRGLEPEPSDGEPSDGEPSDGEPEPEPKPDPKRPEQRRPSMGLLVGGASLLVVGAAGLGTGIALAVPEPKIDESNPLDLITTRPVGYAVLAGGVALAATGAVLTVIGVQRRRRSELSLVPVGTRGYAGLALGGRF